MQAMGLPAAFCRDVVTSGEAVWVELLQRTEPWYAGVGRRCYHIGPDRDAGLLDGLGMELIDDIAGADLVLNTGPWEDDETVAEADVIEARTFSADVIGSVVGA